MKRVEDKTEIPSPSVGPPPPAPPRVPDHELIRRIGRGAYGEVWLARSVTGAYRAAKIISAHSFEDTRPFEREFSGILKFEPISRKHDSQVHILHVGRGEDCFYYVMELADDQFTGQQIQPDTYAPKTLSSEVFQRGRLPFEDCLRISLALATALEHLHSYGLVHRDIKPSNIIFVNGVPKLADIGLVTALDATRSYVGTEGFVPPEGPGTPQADIYSLGKVLYEMCTGKDRQDFPELPTNLDVAADREGLLELNAVIGKACRQDSRQRYASAKAMRDELLLLQSGKSLARLRTVERALGRVKQLSVAGAILTAMVASALVWQVHQARRMKSLATAVREGLYAADIRSTQQALEGDNLLQALDLLNRQIPKPGETDLRGFEWRYLWQQSQSEALFDFHGHKDSLTSLAFSPDGRLMLSGSVDRSARVWDVATRRTIATLTGHNDWILSVAFSPKNDFLATASESELRIWDGASFQVVRSFPRRTAQVCFSPDGRYLAAAYTNLVLWNTTTWEEVRSIELPQPWQSLEDRGYWPGVKPLGLAFSPFDQQLAVVGGDGVTLFTVPQLRGRKLLEARTPRLRFAAFSPDGKILAIPSGARGVKLLDVRTGTEIRVLSGHLDAVNGAAFSPDGKWLATASMDETVKLWDVSTGRLARSYRGHAQEVWSIAFSPDSKVFASGSKDGAVQFWDTAARPTLVSELGDFRPLGFDSAGHSVGFAPALTSYDPQTQQEVRLGFPDSTTNSQAWRRPFVEPGSLCANGRTMAIFSVENLEAEIWDLPDRRLICSLPAHSPHVAFSAKGSLVATATSNKTVTVWQLPAGSQCCLLTNALEPIAFAPDGRILLTFTLNQGESFLDLCRMNGNDRQASITILRTLKGFKAAFSPDGRTLAYACWGGLVRLCDVATGREITTFIGHTRDISGIGFCPDGKTLATSADDGTVRLWHVTTGRELMRFHFPTMDPKIQRLAFSMDGRALLHEAKEYGSPSSTRVYYAPSFAEIAVAEGRDYRPLAQDPATWLAVGEALTIRNRFDDAADAFREVIQRTANHPNLEGLGATALRHLAKIPGQRHASLSQLNEPK